MPLGPVSRLPLLLLLLPLALCSSRQRRSAAKCVDGRSNLVEARSDPKSHFPVVLKRLRGTVYTQRSEPACYKGRPTVLMPGVVKLSEGELLVPPNNFDLLKSGNIRMGIRSPNFADALCRNGTSEYSLLPDSWCNMNLCSWIGNELCQLLQKPGTHTIRELERRLAFNSTLLLPDPPSILGISLLDLLSGEFSFVLSVETGGKTILEVQIPSNMDSLQIGLEETDEEKENK